MTGIVLATCERDELAPPYVAALVAGGIDAEAIRVLTPETEEPAEGWAPLAAAADGVFLGGGPDIHPRFYGEEPLTAASNHIIDRLDRLELAILAGAREAGVPVWGVCRGLQVLNVFLGGSLWQDVPLQVPASRVRHQLAEPRDALAHDIEITAAGTRLGQILSSERPAVNSRHHQAVRAVAPGLDVVATSPDGLVEAAVHRGDGWWVEAVQWHPEDLLALAQQLALWRGFAAAVAARLAGRRGIRA